MKKFEYTNNFESLIQAFAVLSMAMFVLFLGLIILN
jgi:hypothetical protein